MGQHPSQASVNQPLNSGEKSGLGEKSPQRLQQAVLEELRQILYRDSLAEVPVVQSISLFFWQNVQRWVRQIALVPEPFTIALAGASGSGKSFVREVLVDCLSQVADVSSFTQDNYYRDFEKDFPHLSLQHFYDEIDFDDPAHILFGQLASDLKRLKEHSYGKILDLPKLRYGTPIAKPTIIHGGIQIRVSPFIVTEGIHAFYDKSLLPHYDFKIYVDIDEDNRRERWLDRNRRENRGTTDNMWKTTVACLEEFILPSREVADLVMNNNAPQEAVARFLEEVVQILNVAGVDKMTGVEKTEQVA